MLLSSSDTYIVAVKSVSLPSIPASAQYIRSEVICAGFLIQAVDSSSCTVCVMKYLCLHSSSQKQESLFIPPRSLVNHSLRMCVLTKKTPWSLLPEFTNSLSSWKRAACWFPAA